MFVEVHKLNNKFDIFDNNLHFPEPDLDTCWPL